MKKIHLVLLCCLLFATNAFADDAIFAMGCFWSAEAAFRNADSNKPLNGITTLTVGYPGGTAKNPTYENHLGYKEAIKIEFNPKIIPYTNLLDIFWHHIDIFDKGGQICDRGPSYIAAIFYTTAKQKRDAEKSKANLEKRFKTIPIEILPSTTFYPAEDYHQNYKFKNATSYEIYNLGCGREQRLEEIWKQ